jgi:hypothetical protein
MEHGERSVPWGNTIERIQYDGDAINLFPERVSFSCAMGHVRGLRGIILTVRYKQYQDITMISEPPHEERFLATVANISIGGKKKSIFASSTYSWILTELNKIPTQRHGNDGLPMFEHVHDPIIRSTLSSFLISDDGELRPHSQLISQSQ